MSWDDLPLRRRENIQQMLTPRQLQVISRRLNGLSWRQIATDLDLEVSGVRDHYHRGIDRLRKELRT